MRPQRPLPSHTVVGYGQSICRTRCETPSPLLVATCAVRVDYCTTNASTPRRGAPGLTLTVLAVGGPGCEVVSDAGLGCASWRFKSKPGVLPDLGLLVQYLLCFGLSASRTTILDMSDGHG